MTKVCKIMLISQTVNKDGKEIEYKDVCHTLWDLQYQTRSLKNKVVQEYWEWQGFSNDYSKRNEDNYPKPNEHLKSVSKYYSSLDGFIYDKYKSDYDLYSSNFSATARETGATFRKSISDFLKGNKSVLNFKSNQPLDVHNKAITLEYKDDTFYFNLGLLNTAGKKKYNIDAPFRFKALVKDDSTKTILERCYYSIYKISASKLTWDKKKKMWRFNLSYSFEGKAVEALDKDKILGVDLGVVNPVCASIYGDKARLCIQGGEVEEFRKRIESRKYSLCKQTAYCGDGRIGHGYNTKMTPVLKLGDKIARFRDTFNHKVSRALIDYAIKNGCGTIQMEELTGITSEANRFLRNWSYFDLQTKIEYKAKEQGIKVIYIKPRYTSQRCSKCGYIHSDNRPTQARFICQQCGYEENADYNASQNIGIKDIDKIIDQELKVKKQVEQTA